MAKSRWRGALLLLVFLLVFVSFSKAMEPPTKEELRRLAQEGKLKESLAFAQSIGNHRASTALVERFQYKLRRLLLEREGRTLSQIDDILGVPPAWRGMPTKGDVKILALMIDFSGTAHIASDSNAAVGAKLFGDGSGGFPYESLRNFYRRSSYNQLEIGGNVLGWYTTSYSRSSVATTTAGRQALIKEALSYYDSQGHDFTQYDNDGDGAIDYLVVLWAGAHGSWSSFWWGYQTTFIDPSFKLDGKTLSSYSWQWESYNYPSGGFTPNVVIHETGHALGLPDFYDYDESSGISGGVGGLDQMDANQGDHNAFSKWMMEWLTPSVYTAGSNTVNLAATGSSPNAAIFMPDASLSQPYSEFYVVQNRYRTANDTPYPADGLLIWHVDARLNTAGTDFLYDNSYTAHKLLRLMEADGLEEIESGGDADAGDYYVQGRLFGPTTLPSSLRYSGTPTGFGVRSITASGSTTGCEIYRLSDGPPTGTPSAPADEGATTNKRSLTFTWTQGSAADPESGIGGYLLRVGTSSGGSDFFEGDVGKTTTYTVSGASNGSTYYASVKAVNGSGYEGAEWSASSDGITVVLPSLGEALDNTTAVWTTSGSGEWYGQGGVSQDGVDAAQSPILGDYRTASFQTTQVGPGTLTFYWKVSSEQDCDYLRFSLDGSEQFALSGEASWQQKSVSLSSGTHTLRWSYSKDERMASGQDAGWVDRVVFTPAGSLPEIALSRTSLSFGSRGTALSKPQSFVVSNSGLGTLQWSASSNRSWLSFTPTSGTGAAKITVSVNPQGLSAGTYTGTVTVTDPLATNSPRTVTVTLRVYGAATTGKPFGSFDTPGTGVTVSSSIPVTGWALDDVGVVSVKVYREEGSGLAFVADALFIEGARSDVETSYPDTPFRSRGGWGVMLLTNFLPHGDGVYRIHALAADEEGNTTDLGAKVITVDNAHATLPFGAIDTPAQGATVSGSGYVNFGWALTPLPNKIPVDGSTINVWVDGQPLGHPVYNNFRQDIADLFPSYLNSNGAVGYFYLDTTKYADGLHTIAWSVVDNGGRESGIGSRYFSIDNALAGSSIPPSQLSLSDPLRPSFRGNPKKVLRGFQAREVEAEPLEEGAVRVQVSVNEPLTVQLGDDGPYSGFLRVGEEWRPLPIGSTLDKKLGLFAWLPGPGFSGDYDLLFLSDRGELIRVVVRVVCQ